MGSQSFWISSYASPEQAGLIRCCFNPEKGFETEGVYTGFTNPSYVLEHPELPVLYSVEEKTEGAVCAWEIDRGSLKLLTWISTDGADPCYLSLSEDKQWLYAANYSSGSVTCFRLNESGIPNERTDQCHHWGSGPRKDRQETAHAHCAFTRQNRLFVCDLGMDEIVIYENDWGELRVSGRLKTPAGSGPRHLAIHPAHPELLYCVTELDSTVLVWKEDESGTFSLIQQIPMIPMGYSGDNTAAAIRFTENGNNLLVSHRGLNSIAVMSVEADGTIENPVLSPCVRWPRDFMITGNTVLVASQYDGEVRAYRLHKERLEDTGMFIKAQAPVCLQRRIH